EFYDLVNEYIDIFAQNDSDLERTDEIQYEIKNNAPQKIITSHIQVN
ncbi:1793_t:CDS:2, partial [Racocetra fulgida]